MAWYHGTYSCGHDGRIDIIGPTKDRQWKADRKFEGLCSDCYEKKKEKERLTRMAEAEQKTKDMELPHLKGTSNQIAWANTLRLKLIDLLDKIVEQYIGIEQPYAKIEHVEAMENIIEFMIKTKQNASWYIDCRNIYESDDLEKLIIELINEYIKEKQIEELPKEIVDETTLEPKECTHNGRVEIIIAHNLVKAKYEKNEDFINIVKSLKFKWNGIWEREIFETTGAAEERAAELGNKLLHAGFRVTIQDEKVRSKAINGTYEQECGRWIEWNIKNKRLAIKWYDKNDYLYNAARHIASAFWYSETKSILVDIAHWDEVVDFANIYEFRLSKVAKSKIEEFKSIIYDKVEPAIIEEKELIDKLKNILNTSDEILGDLLDEN